MTETPEFILEYVKPYLFAEFTEKYAGLTLGLIGELLSEGRYLGMGTTRVVFNMGDNVMKIPYTASGITANSRESRTFASDDTFIPVAECVLDNTVFGDGDVETLIMEAVNPVRADYGNMPDWVSYVDCGQVGYTRKGELVAYDL